MRLMTLLRVDLAWLARKCLSQQRMRAAGWCLLDRYSWLLVWKPALKLPSLHPEVHCMQDEVDDEYNMVEEEAEFDLENLPSKWWEDMPGEDILGSLSRQREEQMAGQMASLSVNEVGLDIDENEDEDED